MSTNKIFFCVFLVLSGFVKVCSGNVKIINRSLEKIEVRLIFPVWPKLTELYDKLATDKTLSDKDKATISEEISGLEAKLQYCVESGRQKTMNYKTLIAPVDGKIEIEAYCQSGSELGQGRYIEVRFKDGTIKTGCGENWLAGSLIDGKDYKVTKFDFKIESAEIAAKKQKPVFNHLGWLPVFYIFTEQ